MTELEWEKYKRFFPERMASCPICNEEITESERKDLTYSKTRGGTHLFIHEKCLRKGKIDS
jgi:hypothetical protein